IELLFCKICFYIIHYQFIKLTHNDWHYILHDYHFSLAYSQAQLGSVCTRSSASRILIHQAELDRQALPNKIW
ncbi:hypothetical protein, partial [Candidatus Albibeggiatoa sp. nov. BB20]|uniref:hypothetical protein n=1 Tax=Candidatus Albibeggiatoa sp. nov. BB20 TaxID=3162723 RepID=UPI0033658602